VASWLLSNQVGYRSSLNKLISSLLSIFFRLLYNRFAWAYNLVAQTVSLGMWFEWVFTVIPYLDQGPILELGFGTGQLLGELNKRGSDVVGIDQSVSMARLAGSGLRKKGFFPKLVNGSAQNLPFCDHSFQRVASTFPSPYILERQTWLEIWRVLSPGGSAVIIPTAWITGNSNRYRLAARLFRVTHQAPSTENELDIATGEFQRLLHSAGFVVRQRIIELPQSKVLCILAEKPL
jgi:ubiquinone/menaquinone biosynthesis C-methylase UbiE